MIYSKTLAKNKKMNVKVINKSAFSLPQYETIGSAGMDLRANITEPIILESMGRTLVPTGLYLELPIGTEAQIRPRSGLAIKKGLTCLNAPGTIDSDYRGEIKVILANLGKDTQTIEPGERVAQMVIAEYVQIAWETVDVLSDSVRGTGGFGSTGKG